jgi:rubrerythrin
MEVETQRFYERAAARISDTSTRKLLGDRGAERQHVKLPTSWKNNISPEARADEDRRTAFVVLKCAPGLSGLMDGSVSLSLPFCSRVRDTK